MTDALGHRGPDDRGFWIDEELPVFFGHRRLAIVDLAGGAQPMATSQQDIVATFNGEIYNHVELREELSARGHAFQTHHSDTEVLLHGYREWGMDLVEYLNGMWAFALFDRARRKVILSRDRFGEKPLYYAAQRGLFAFASELSALVLHPQVKTEVSERSLQKYYAYGYIPAPLSIYRGASKLAAGTSLEYSFPQEELALRRYWKLNLQPVEPIPAKDPVRELSDEFVYLLRKSVKRRLQADVDVGVFLSGGIDSSLIAALAASESPGPIRTFNIGFDEPSFDESAEAAQVASAVGAIHYNAMLSLDHSTGLLPDIVGTLDEPFGDSSLLPTWLVSQHARQHVKVALGGDGGDELFAGYDPFAAIRKAQAYQRFVPRPVHKAVGLLVAQLPVSHRYMSLDFRLKRALAGLDHSSSVWTPIWMAPLQPAELNRLFGCQLDLEDVYSEAISSWDQNPGANIVDRVIQFFTDLYLADDILTKTDRASMMHGLEVRAPFLDVEVAEFVAGLPWTFKYRRGQRKYLLKKAAEGIVPDPIIHRAKQGFAVPIGRWFHEGSLAIEPDTQIPHVRSEVVDQFSRAHRGGKQDHRLFLWNHWVISRMSMPRSVRTSTIA
jgi:asparagine synthase (glutamine-hydrolysing)